MGDQRCMHIANQHLLICRTESSVYALENRCPHASFPLEGGQVNDGVIRCPTHGARFRLEDGSPLTGRMDHVQTFPVEIIDEQIFVLI